MPGRVVGGPKLGIERRRLLIVTKRALEVALTIAVQASVVVRASLAGQRRYQRIQRSAGGRSSVLKLRQDGFDQQALALAGEVLAHGVLRFADALLHHRLHRGRLRQQRITHRRAAIFGHRSLALFLCGLGPVVIQGIQTSTKQPTHFFAVGRKSKARALIGGGRRRSWRYRWRRRWRSWWIGLRILWVSLRILRISLRILRISLRILRISLGVLRIPLWVLRIPLRILWISLWILWISLWILWISRICSGILRIALRPRRSRALLRISRRWIASGWLIRRTASSVRILQCR